MTIELTRPSLFIGSSVERLDIAYAFQEHLEFVMEATVWTQDIFKPTSFALVDLERAIRKFQFAVFVFAPDDLITIRGAQAAVVRDNIVFEFGLFIGALGLARCFLLMPRGADPLHLPTDLLGLTPLTYASDRSDKNLLAALGPAANRVRRAVRQQLSAHEAAANEPAETSATRAARIRFLTAQDYEALWGSTRFRQARNLISNLPSNPYGYEDEELGAHAALRQLFALLESMADDVLSGRIDEVTARGTFERPIRVLWPHMFTLMAPPNHAEDWWDPPPRIAELFTRWSRPEER